MQGSYRLDPEIVGRRHFQTFTEGHELDRKWRVAKAMIGRRLSQADAKRLLARSNDGRSAYQEFIGAKKHLVLGAVSHTDPPQGSDPIYTE
jgi:hypothetical protein